jgi:glycine betaine/choline ABC-type transport system substrate-binding protein
VFKSKLQAWPALFAILAAVIQLSACGSGKPPISVGSKTSAEQQLLGEIVAQHIEKRLPERKVNRKFSLGNTMMLHTAIVGGEVDLFPEDSGTALVSILREEPIADGSVAIERVRSEYLRQYQVVVLKPLGFSHQFVIVAQDPPPAGTNAPDLSSSAALHRSFKLSVAHGFSERKDGYQLLMTRYKPSMAQLPQTLEPAQLYDGLKTGQVEWAAGYSTDAWISEPGFRIVKDDQGVFTKQPAFIAVRSSVLKMYPDLGTALEMLSGKFTDDSIRKLAGEVALKHRPITDVAREFLASAGL